MSTHNESRKNRTEEIDRCIHTSTYERICPDEVGIDPRVQRALNRNHPIFDTSFDPNRWGLGTLSQRSDGSYVALDAQHRIVHAVESGFGSVPMMFQVFRNLSLAEEAQLFDVLQKARRPVSPVESYRINVTAGDAAHVESNAILASLNLRVAAGKMPGTIWAAKAVLAVHKKGVLFDTLKVLTDAWGRNPDALDGGLLKAVSAFLVKYPDVDRERLSEKLKSGLVPSRVQAGIKALSEQIASSFDEAAITYLKAQYNKQLAEDSNKRLV